MNRGFHIHQFPMFRTLVKEVSIVHGIVQNEFPITISKFHLVKLPSLKNHGNGLKHDLVVNVVQNVSQNALKYTL